MWEGITCMTGSGGSGLGASDLRQTMQSIEAHHKVVVTMVWSLGGVSGKDLVVSLRATERSELSAQAGAWPGSALRSWHTELWVVPHDAERLCSLLYRGLLKLDWELSRERWGQQQLPLT